MKIKRLTVLSTVLLLTASTPLAFAGNIIIEDGVPLNIDGFSTNATKLVIGEENPDNTMNVLNSGSVDVETINIGRYQSSVNNALVIESGSIVKASDSVSVGTGGTGNRLTVDGFFSRLVVGEEDADYFSFSSLISVGSSNGASALSINNSSLVKTEELVLGSKAGTSGSISVSGTGSELIVAENAYIGPAGSGSTLTLFDGSSMTVSNGLQIGENSSSNNVLKINKGGTLVLEGSATVYGADNGNRLNLNGGHLVYKKDAHLGNLAEKGVSIAKNSTLEVGGTLTYGSMNEGYNLILNNGLSGETALWDTGSSAMLIGDTVSGNTLTLKEGATAISGTGTAKIGEASSNNRINVTGTNSALQVNGKLRVGMTGSNNQLTVSENGSAAVTEDTVIGFSAAKNAILVSGTNSALNIGGDTLVGKFGDNNRLAIWNSANADFGGGLFLGAETGSTGNSFGLTNAAATVAGDFGIGLFGENNSASLFGSNTTANVGGDLLLGLNGGDNLLEIESGAMLVLTGNAYMGTNSANNTLAVSGTNSSFSVGGDFLMGSLDADSAASNNTLYVWNTAQLTVGGNMTLGNSSDFNIAGDARVNIGGDYYQDETSRLAFHIPPTGLNITNMVVQGTATFASNSTIIVRDTTSGWKTNEFEQVILSSSGLYLGGGTNAATTELLNDPDLINFKNSLMDVDASVVDNAILLKIERQSVSKALGLSGTQTGRVADQIDGMAANGDTRAAYMRNILGGLSPALGGAAMKNYYGAKESSIPANNIINLGLQSVSKQLNMRADNTRARMSEGAASPVGAAGPHDSGQELQGWATAYNTWINQDADSGFGSYDGDIGGFMIGADFSVAENVLIGVAGGSSDGSIDMDNSAHTDIESFFGAVYTSVGTKDWFIDASVIYGSSSVDNRLGSLFDTTGKYDAMNMAFYLGGGKEYTGEYLIITPEVSILANYYEQDSYTETAINAVGRDIDGYDQLYLQSSLGCSIAMYTSMGQTTLKPEFRAHWLHEFNADEETVPYTLFGGGFGTYDLVLQAPEEDILKLGAGLSAKVSEYLELRADIDTRQSANYSDYTVLGSLRYQF